MRITALFVALPLVARAQTAEQRLDLSELVGEALRRNPEILAAQKKYEASRQRPIDVTGVRRMHEALLTLGSA